MSCASRRAARSTRTPTALPTLRWTMRPDRRSRDYRDLVLIAPAAITPTAVAFAAARRRPPRARMDDVPIDEEVREARGGLRVFLVRVEHVRDAFDRVKFHRHLDIA